VIIIRSPIPRGTLWGPAGCCTYVEQKTPFSALFARPPRKAIDLELLSNKTPLVVLQALVEVLEGPILGLGPRTAFTNFERKHNWSAIQLILPIQ